MTTYHFRVTGRYPNGSPFRVSGHCTGADTNQAIDSAKRVVASEAPAGTVSKLRLAGAAIHNPSVINPSRASCTR